MAAEKQIHVQMFRGLDEPRLNPGEPIQIKDGLSGIVRARFSPKTDPTKVGYLVEPQRLTQSQN